MNIFYPDQLCSAISPNSKSSVLSRERVLDQRGSVRHQRVTQNIINRARPSAEDGGCCPVIRSAFTRDTSILKDVCAPQDKEQGKHSTPHAQ